MRARKYAHAVDRYDNARARHGENVLAFVVAFVAFVAGSAVAVLAHTASVSAFAFGSAGQTFTRGASLVALTVLAYPLALIVRDVRASRAHVRATSVERNTARHEMLRAFQ
jgi:chromate transport protein ChrA